MRFEPIGYIYEYEIGALIVFLVIMLRFFGARRFPNQKNRLYALLVWATIADIILDVLSALIIDNVFLVPDAVVSLANIAFYAITVLMLILMMMYTYALIGYISKERLLRIVPLLLPGVILLVMLISNPLTHWFFYVDPEEGYVHAVLFWLIYAVCFVYILFTLAIALRNRAVLRREEFSSIVLFLAVVFCSTVVQFFIPPLLITGVAIVLAVILMYFTIQKPESMVDMASGAFTYDAMLKFLRDRMQEHDRVQLVAVKIYNMSRINDLLGIENGSLLLRQLYEYIGENANDTWIFRMRGSCFVAITRQREDYAVIRTRLAQRIGEPWTVNGTDVLLQAAVCCVETAGLLANPILPEEAVNYLETAFDEHERERDRERIVQIVVGPELLERIMRRNAIEAALRSALVSGEGLELHFQPLWSVHQKRYVSAEALLRFRHPVLGSIPPDEFVAIAESKGFVTLLDAFTVRQACAFMREHDDIRRLGIETLEVNLSALEFMQRRLPVLLRDIMSQYQIDPRFLCFEVTETSASESFQLLQDCMTEIMQFGCQFALDDFGVGYANISQVIQLPFNIVKIDKSMLYGPPAVLEDIVQMFARIERKTVVEGVETAQQAAMAEACGADVIQGFYYAKPMDGDRFIRFLQEAHRFDSAPAASADR